MSLTASRNTPQWGAIKAVLDDLELPQKGSTKIYQGALVVLNAGYAAPGSTATGLIAAGVAFLNPNIGVSDTTGLADGSVTIRVRQGVFRFLNGAGGDVIAQADVGKYCWITDDQTVAKSSNSSAKSKAGIIIAVDASGVWVDVGLQLNPAPAAAAT